MIRLHRRVPGTIVSKEVHPMSSEGKMKKSNLMLFLIGVTLVSGLIAVQQFLEAFGVGAREQHLQEHPLTPFHVSRHIMITGVFALISAISGAALFRSRRTPPEMAVHT